MKKHILFRIDYYSYLGSDASNEHFLYNTKLSKECIETFTQLLETTKLPVLFINMASSSYSIWGKDKFPITYTNTDILTNLCKKHRTKGETLYSFITGQRRKDGLKWMYRKREKINAELDKIIKRINNDEAMIIVASFRDAEYLQKNLLDIKKVFSDVAPSTQILNSWRIMCRENWGGTSKQLFVNDFANGKGDSQVNVYPPSNTFVSKAPRPRQKKAA